MNTPSCVVHTQKFTFSFPNQSIYPHFLSGYLLLVHGFTDRYAVNVLAGYHEFSADISARTHINTHLREDGEFIVFGMQENVSFVAKRIREVLVDWYIEYFGMDFDDFSKEYWNRFVRSYVWNKFRQDAFGAMIIHRIHN